MKIKDIFELIYCINLDVRNDKWNTSKKEFEKLNISPTRFEAIKNDYPPRGCLLSHLEILKIASKENKNVLIFEDDIEIIEPLDTIERALDELNEFDWCMFYLGGNILKPFYQIRKHLAVLCHCQSTHAYGINKEYLKPIIDSLEGKDYYIDLLYCQEVIPKYKCYITVPMTAIQRTAYSDIEKKIMSYDVPISRYKTFLTKTFSYEGKYKPE